jgi:archaellum component FlaC
MPENLQYSYQGERSEEAIDIMTDAVDNLGKITETITKSISEIDDVVGDLESLY